MNVGDICPRNTVTARPFDDLTTAAQLMREMHVGYVMVVEPGTDESTFKPAGVSTDGDIVVAVVAREADPRSLRTADVMTPAPVVAEEKDALGTALQKMRKIGVQRLPVVGARGELAGVISLDDIIDALVGELEEVPRRHSKSVHTREGGEFIPRSFALVNDS
jgi:CBS domain-containing protein